MSTKQMEISKIKPNISPEEQEELRKFVAEIVAMGWGKFQELKPQLKGYGSKIMRFFTLPRTDLHSEYLRMIVEPRKKLEQERLSKQIQAQMRQGKSEFITEHLIEEGAWESVKYRIVGRRSYVDPKTRQKMDILHIAIPYFSPQLGRDKFGYGILVNHTQTPTLFEEFVEKIPRYTGDSDLVSKKM